jgi:hypothetical protein
MQLLAARDRIALIAAAIGDPVLIRPEARPPQSSGSIPNETRLRTWNSKSSGLPGPCSLCHLCHLCHLCQLHILDVPSFTRLRPVSNRGELMVTARSQQHT